MLRTSQKNTGIVTSFFVCKASKIKQKEVLNFHFHLKGISLIKNKVYNDSQRNANSIRTILSAIS
jgi:hypothetical protein